jgi:hypothetical protein
MRGIAWVAAMAIGCAGQTTDTATGTPSIKILSPADGSTVCGTPLVVDVDVQNFVLVDPSTEDLTPGHGHIDMFLNGQGVDMQPAEHMLVPNVGDGAWQLKVELVNSNHTASVPYEGGFVYMNTASSACDTGA